MTDNIEQNAETLTGEEEYGNIEDLITEPDEELSSEENSDDGEVTTPELPEKFQGKSIEDVVKSYEEVEKALGRKNNEVGELRKLTDEFLRQSLQPDTGGSPAQAVTEVGVDELLEDPNKTINDAVSNNPRLKQLEEQLLNAQRVEGQKGFEAKHPGGMDRIVSSEVQEWINASPVRQKLFAEAHANYDFGIADELLSTYESIHGVKVEEAKGKQKAKRDQALKDAATEKGSTGQSSKKIFKRTDLMKMMVNNRKAYDSPSFQAKLAQAYQEGRVR